MAIAPIKPISVDLILKSISEILSARFSDVNEAREMESWLALTSLIKLALILLELNHYGETFCDTE